MVELNVKLLETVYMPNQCNSGYMNMSLQEIVASSWLCIANSTKKQLSFIGWFFGIFYSAYLYAISAAVD